MDFVAKMKGAKDPEIIRLFGKKIALPEKGRGPPVISAVEDSVELGKKNSFPENGRMLPGVVAAGDVGDSGSNQKNSFGSDRDRGIEEKIGSKVEEDDDEEFEEADEEKTETNKDQNSIAEESPNPKVSSELDCNSNTTQANDDSITGEHSKNRKDQDDVANPQQKTLKKPDKILPCPRCNSMDTKFCYYNNYNVNQPRHFCKKCQRYWTAGGTMRKVPVGAGRRKNKTSNPHCGHISMSEALHGAQIDAPNGYHHLTFQPKGTVLSFGSDSPLCESMASVLNLVEKKAPNGTQNGYFKIEKGVPVPCKGGENVDDCSSGSSITTSSSNAPQEPVMQNMNGFQSPIPCLPGHPWPFQWNPSIPMPAICPPGYPMPFYPAPYWNYSVPGPWNVPWLSPTSPTVNQKVSVSGPKSPTLGKHSRDGELLQPNTAEGKQSSEKKNSKGSVLVPKTLRIDDPDEAAKSSIWATLGIKYDSVNRGRIFNGFQSKADQKKHVATPSPVLQANPAALSRALSYQETA